MRVTTGFVWLMSMAVLLAAGCQQREASRGESADALAQLIVGHTSGVVSRKTEIRVVFARDVIPADPNAVPAPGLLRVRPTVAGDVQFRGPREVVLKPTQDLKPGQEYRVTVSPASLPGVERDVQPYAFNFRVQTPQFDVVLDGLETDPLDDRRMTLHGIIVTADLADDTPVERILRPRLRDEVVRAIWSHSSNGREHRFTLNGIEQRATAADLTLLLDGSPIGANRAEERRVSVPAANEFVVTTAQALEQQNRKEIRVSFSNRLDERQDLTGLVRLSAGEFRTRIEQNTLTIYPQDGVSGNVTITLEPGIRNARGEALKAAAAHTLTFTSEKPQVRFVGSGVILPDGTTLSVPFEAVSARSVRVIATLVYPDNLPQFLQVNSLPGSNELGRVGRYLWRKTLPLDAPPTGRWQRYDLDVTELVSKHPGALLQLSLRLTPADSAYACAGEDDAPRQVAEPELSNQESGDVATPSPWDFAEDYFGVSDDGPYDYESRWRDRNDPCKAAYYAYASGTRAQRNVLASNIGLLAKSDAAGRMLVSVTDLRSAQPKSGVALSVRNFQNQVIGAAVSDAAGLATLEPTGTPFLLIAENGRERGYLKLNAGTALPVSHFDVGGEAVTQGLKGSIYGERGVWRPGDTMHLTFVLHDRDRTLPPNHPATLELLDPRGRSTETVVNTAPLGGFYRFDVRTAPDAPTGDWTAKVSFGGATIRKTLKVETVMPNRLKIELDLGDGTIGAGDSIAGAVRSEWLTGASASGLATDVSLRLVPTPTHFDRFTDYAFDDPAREFRSEQQEIFAGKLDETGNATFDEMLDLAAQPPGMLRADFMTRVFERGGAFSVNHESRAFAPYSRFVGLRLPKGDVARGMLRTDTDHVLEIGTLSADGAPIAAGNLKVALYKLEWRWWWDRSDDSLAQYVARNNRSLVREATVATDADGRGQWTLRLDYPEWGRYLVRVCDEQGGHCAGSTFYVDWPSWAGKEREQSGPAASMLNLTADKASYSVGDTATIQLPESAQGRALVTVENGSRILDARWVTPSAGNTRVEIPVTAAMTPNAYVAVTLVQPHEGKTNDRPIRLYGVIPLEVEDEATRLTPVLETAEEWRPESQVSIDVREALGKPMTYTLAVVDEGLLSLTGFRTPDLHNDFFRREALGVRTWDVFDDVIGAYGTELERLLALGGSDAGAAQAARREQSRFPPVAQLLGPFSLEAGATQRQTITLPRYVGAVRVMLVAGDNDSARAAFGSIAKTVPVRQPLMILPTMSRVIGPNEEITVPVSVFAMDSSIRDVIVEVRTDAMFEVLGEPTVRVSFTGEGEQLGELRLRAAGRLGVGRVRFTAVSAEHRVESEIAIEVRSSNPPTTRVETKPISPGETWTTRVSPHGLPGTNRTTLEVSALPPLNIDSRLAYLVQYPHGCLEQTTSSAFPQLFLSSLLELDDSREQEIERNVRGGIERLRLFQLADGGFSYWPGGNDFANGSLEGYELWATTYASHFLVEAEKRGYTVPASMRAGLIRNLRGSAQDWSANKGTAMDQAYRLYVLALAGQPEIGAMNRLREQHALGAVERWTLAAAYQLAGLRDAATPLADGDVLAVRDRAPVDYTFGSELRDHGLVLQAMVTVDRLGQAEPLVRAISDELGTERWYSTQAVAYSLLAMSQLAGASKPGSLSFEQTVGNETRQIVSDATVHQAELTSIPDAGRLLTLRNTSAQPLFATVAVRGIPAVQQEDASAQGLALQIHYSNHAGEPLDVARLKQGEDIVADIEVRNTSTIAIDNIALTQIVPAGWEIHNERLGGSDTPGVRDGAASNPFDGTRAATTARIDYLDIRDDRVLRYFGLRPGESIRFETRVNAAYRGRFYLPSVIAEAMYDASTQAHTAGHWTEIAAR